MTTRQIKAYFHDGVFVPDEAIGLEDGCEVTIEVTDSESGSLSSETLDEMFERLQREYPVEQRELMPTDGARHYRHYLYGHPKRD